MKSIRELVRLRRPAVKVKQPHLPAQPKKKPPPPLTWKWVKHKLLRAPHRLLARWVAAAASGPNVNIVRSEIAARGFDLFERRPRHHYVLDYYGYSSPKLFNPLDNPERYPDFLELADQLRSHKRTASYYDRLYTFY